MAVLYGGLVWCFCMAIFGGRFSVGGFWWAVLYGRFCMGELKERATGVSCGGLP